MRICGKVTYRDDDVTQREWGRSGGEYTLRNSHIFGGIKKQRLHGQEWPGATAVNGKDEVVGFWQWRHLTVTWVEAISELWGQDAVLDLRRELELSFLNA